MVVLISQIFEKKYIEKKGSKMKHSNALQNTESKKTPFVCNEEITFVINRNYFCNVVLKVENDKNIRKLRQKKQAKEAEHTKEATPQRNKNKRKAEEKQHERNREAHRNTRDVKEKQQRSNKAATNIRNTK